MIIQQKNIHQRRKFMKKKIFLTMSVFMLLLISVFSVSAAEKNVTIDGVTYQLTESKTDGQYYMVVGFFTEETVDKAEEINIATKISNIPVLSVEGRLDPELTNDINYSVKKITLPEGLKYIGYFGLSNFKNVKELILPSTLKDLGKGGLSGMENLQSVTIPKGVTKIKAQAFAGCKNLSNVIFEGKIKSIGENAFLNCQKLKSIALPESLTKIYGSAFRKSGLVSVIIPAKADVSKGSIFEDCKTLKTVIFDGCERKSGLNIGLSVFENCTSLKKIYLPEETKCVKINDRAFYGCTSLKTVYHSENIVKINKDAFRNCKSLKKIELGEVTKIGKTAFYNCTKLKSVSFENGKSASEIQKKAFGKTATGISFTSNSKTVAKKLKANLKNAGAKNIKVRYITVSTV